MKKKEILKRLMRMYADIPQKEIPHELSSLVNDLGGYSQMEKEAGDIP